MIDIVTDHTYLRTFTGRLAAETGCSELVILRAMATLIAQERGGRTDDTAEVFRLRRHYAAVRLALDHLICA
jgi:hypothetical protein